MASIDIIDTTEMYLKTIYELEEDGVTPLRARIVERLGHSGPTVSQTISRMERDGLVWVRSDRRLELTPGGREIAVSVMRKHRLAERLLVDVIGMSWVSSHDEACRWEHVMSAAVEDRLLDLLDGPTLDPYGNPIPGEAQHRVDEVSLEIAARGSDDHRGTVTRIGEVLQAEGGYLGAFNESGVVPGAEIGFRCQDEEYLIWPLENPDQTTGLKALYAAHLFVADPQSLTRK